MAIMETELKHGKNNCYGDWWTLSMYSVWYLSFFKIFIEKIFIETVPPVL